MGHDSPGCQNRTFEPFQRGHGPGLAGGTVHQAGVELIDPGGVGRGPPTGDVEAGHLEGDHGGDADIEGGVPPGETVAAGLDQSGHVSDLMGVIP